MIKPLVSIVMPVYNSAEFVGSSIESVLEQTYKNWELLIVNDASTDDSMKVIAKFLQDERIRVLTNESNKGIAETRNHGIKEAKGEYIAFLDSDDRWMPNKLVVQVKFMIDRGIDFICSSYYVANEQGEVTGERRFSTGFQSYKELLKTNNIGCLTVMVEAQLMKKNLMPDIKHEDYATWLHILRKGEKIYYLAEKLAVYTVRDNSVSANKLNTVSWVWNIFHHELKYSRIQSVALISRFLFFTSLKYLRK